MELLTNVANLWNEFLVGGIASYIVALIIVAIVFALTHRGHLISAGVTALVAGVFGTIAKIAFYVGIFLLVVKMILNFI